MSDLTLVCLHGLGRSPADWDGVRAGLETFGEVSAPQLPRDPANALVVTGEVTPPGAIVIGHSIGAVLALRLELERPRGLAAVVLSDGFFPPARNGRSGLRTVGNYLAHRVAYVRDLRSRAGAPSDPTPRAGNIAALTSLVGLAARHRRFEMAANSVNCPVLVVHARDDHHVPVDFALAAANRHKAWDIEILERGGHHSHVTEPELWLLAVTPWLEARLDPGPRARSPRFSV